MASGGSLWAFADSSASRMKSLQPDEAELVEEVCHADSVPYQRVDPP